MRIKLALSGALIGASLLFWCAGLVRDKDIVEHEPNKLDRSIEASQIARDSRVGRLNAAPKVEAHESESSALVENDELAHIAKTIKKYSATSRKALLTQEEKQARRQALASEQNLVAIRDALITGNLGEGWGDISKQEQWVLKMAEGDDYTPTTENYQRMQLISFLADALRWSDNPSRATAVQAASSIVAADTLQPNLSLQQLRSLAGDKIELLGILMRTDRALAESLLDQSRGTANEKVLQLAWGMFSAR